ncbi:MAG: hypothetical protein AAFO91_11600 [Bacteroidota bacterium]
MKSVQQIDAATVGEWYNSNMIRKEEQIALADVSITIDGQMLTVPGIDITPHTTIDDIVRGWFTYLKENGPTQIASSAQIENELGDNVNFDQIDYRGHEYMVEHWLKGDEHTYIVKRKADGSEVNPASPNAKKIVSMFKEKYPPGTN